VKRWIALVVSFGLLLALATPAAGSTNASHKATGRAGVVRSASVSALAVDDNVPGVPIPSSPFGGTLDQDIDYDDVYSIYLAAGQVLQASITGDGGTDFDLYLYAPGTTDVMVDDWVALAEEVTYPDTFVYTASVSGTYYLDAYAATGSGSYTITYDAAAPVVVCSPLSVYTDSALIDVSASDAGVGVKDVSYSLDGEATVTVSGASAQVSTSVLGTHSLSVWATDNIGNSSAPVQHSFTVEDDTVLGLTPSVSTPAYGSRVALTATLKRSGQMSAVSGKTVVFERQSGSSWLSVGTASTDALGVAAVSLTPYGNAKTTYRARFAQSSPYRASSSAPVVITPKVQLTRSTTWSTLSVNKTYYSKGFVAPKHATSDSNKIKIRAYKRASNGKYYYKKSFTASYSYYSSSKTRYKAAVKLTSKGTWKLVAYHAADSKNAKTYGSADYVKVK
jgi:hypothetical protein